jgi:DNA-binding winged helix-turn-helix (wHTH) protein/Flp pilus assembly protein TadD
MQGLDQFVYEFGPFRLVESEWQLLRRGQHVPLRPKVFQLLVAFVREAGHALTKEELLARVWPDTFVEDHNLAVHISELRKALGREHSYVETVACRGYRFVAKVHKHRGGEHRTAASEAHAEDVRGRAWRAQRAVAVLPFKTIPGEAADGYLGLGLADALITKLSALSKVIVRPTSSVRRYAAEADPVSAGRELQVGLILDGNIRRVGGRVRVTVQLIGVEDGVTLWAGKYDESFQDLLELEDSISEQAAAALALELTAEESRHLTKRHTDNLEAYLEYMKGRYFWNRRSLADIKRSIECFGRAAELDPECAPAYMGLAQSNISMYSYGLLAPHESFPRTKAFVERALELDDSLAEAHAVMGQLLHFNDWDWAGAEREFKRAIAADPNNALVHECYARFLALEGRFDEALAFNLTGQILDPTSLVINATACRILYFARRYEQSIEHAKKTLELEADFAMGHFILGTNYVETGEYEKALEEYERYDRLNTHNPEILSSMSRAYALAGMRREALRLLDEVLDLSTRNYVPPYYVAYSYCALGENVQGLAWLEKAYEARDCELLMIDVDPRLDALRAEPRFFSLLERLRSGHDAAARPDAPGSARLSGPPPTAGRGSR